MSNRQFKFRVWSKKFNGWANHCAVIDCNGLVVSHFVEVTEDQKIIEHVIPFPKDDCIVQQFIGVFDRTGKEIFEGDLLRGYRIHEKSDSLFCVEWCRLEAADDMDMDSYGFHFSPYWYEWEIEGNILENPNLIEKI